MNLTCLDTCQQSLISFCSQHDKSVFQRKRKWRTLNVVLSLCKLTLMGRTIGIPTLLSLASKDYVSSSRSAFAMARKKIGAEVFRKLTQLTHNSCQAFIHKRDLWRGHRIFAIDGTKVNISRKLLASKYPRVNQCTHYPQALITALFQLRTKLFVDYKVSRHNNENKNVKHHLQFLNPNDIVLYDRLYFNFRILKLHQKSKVNAVFRLKSKNTFREVTQFISSGKNEAIIKICRNDVNIDLRLIRRIIKNKCYYFATTLLNSEKYPRLSISKLYGERWQLEVAFKHCKRSLGLEYLRAESPLTLKQEIGAVFLSYQLTQISELRPSNSRPSSTKHVSQILGYSLCQTGVWNISSLIWSYKNVIPDRPGRVFLRVSKKPINRWQRSTNREWRRMKRQMAQRIRA